MLPIFNKKINIGRYNIPLVTAIIIALLLCLVVGIGARYVYVTSTKPVTQISALDFYFTVDLLGDTNELSDLEKDIHLYGGNAKTVSFNVQNYFDELRINAKEIKYTVDVSTDLDSYDGKWTITSAPSDKTMTAGTAETDTYTLSLPTGYEQQGKPTVVTATVKSSTPYTKEMKLNFLLHSTDAPVTYRVVDNPGDAYAKLIVMVSENIDAGKIKVDWSNVNAQANILQIDTTSPQILDGTIALSGVNDPANQTSGYLSQVTTTKALGKGSSMQIYFFKSNPALDYSKPDTQLALVDGVYTATIEQN